MIGKLKGIVDSYSEDAVILDVNGVGYLVHCSARTLQELPRVGEPTALAIETHVREDQIMPHLARRELDVCVGIMQGKSSEAIALALGISVNTVRTYRKRAYARLGITSHNELMRLVLV